MQSGHRNRIWQRKMCHAYNKKCKKSDNGRNRTSNSRKNQNAHKKGNLQVLRNIGGRHHQISGDKIKKWKKGYLRLTRKLLETKLCSRNLRKGIINPCKIPGTILKMNEGITQTNGPEKKKNIDRL